MSQCPPRRSLYFQYKHYTPLLTGLSLEWNPPAHKSEISHISSRFGQNRTQPNFSNQRDPAAAWSGALALARENTIIWRSNIMCYVRSVQHRTCVFVTPDLVWPPPPPQPPSHVFLKMDFYDFEGGNIS